MRFVKELLIWIIGSKDYPKYKDKIMGSERKIRWWKMTGYDNNLNFKIVKLGCLFLLILSPSLLSLSLPTLQFFSITPYPSFFYSPPHSSMHPSSPISVACIRPLPIFLMSISIKQEARKALAQSSIFGQCILFQYYLIYEWGLLSQ